jgi:hypothetical protein
MNSGVIQIAPVMPRPGSMGGALKEESPGSPGCFDDDDDLGKKRKKVKALDPKVAKNHQNKTLTLIFVFIFIIILFAIFMSFIHAFLKLRLQIFVSVYRKYFL